MNATRRLLPDGRWHWQHGPIDLVIAAEGEPGALESAHRDAWELFQPLLATLVAELPRLRAPVTQAGDGPGDVGAREDRCAARLPDECMSTEPPNGVVARAMWRACRPHAASFITPMAAVAGAVADAVAAAYRRPGVRRAWVNNGGDIALHLSPDSAVRVGLVAEDHPSAHATRGRRPAVVLPDARFEVRAGMPVRGIATSGWGGRSFSLGIADAVTVLARDAAAADAAATMIANVVNVDHPGIRRRPACDLKDDSDLGERLVTVEVPPLPESLVDAALAAGLSHAASLQRRGLVVAASLVCQRRLAVLPPGTGARDDASRQRPATSTGVKAATALAA